MLLPDFFSITTTFTPPPPAPPPPPPPYYSSLRQIIATTPLSSPDLCLAVLNNSRTPRRESIFSTAYRALWSIAIHATLLASFFAWQYLVLSSSFQLCFQILNNLFFPHTATSTSLLHRHVFKMSGFAFSKRRFY